MNATSVVKMVYIVSLGQACSVKQAKAVCRLLSIVVSLQSE